MKKIILSSLVLLLHMTLCAQDYLPFQKTIKKLYSVKGDSEAESLWKELSTSQSVPLVCEDSVAFLYYGDGKSVGWMGDFNGWGYDKTFKPKPLKIPNTKFWILKTSFPKDSRFDYKIVVDDNNWILDPANPYQQWSGVGGGSPNSELRMPDWKEDPIDTPLPNIQKGKVEKDILINSSVLKYQITYNTYIPPGYDPNITYPVIYVTDGYEYMHERMGNMITILDNLITLKKIKPIIAVFIDHREPVNRSNNRRMNELAMSERYLQFVTDELIPQVESKYHISKDPTQRAILGTSMGGLTAAYFAFSKPAVFGMAGIQFTSILV